jgi:hypothetical protein
MTDDVANLVLEQLRGPRNDIQGLREEVHAEFKDLKLRLSGLEGAAVGSRRDTATTQEDVYRQQGRIDQIIERLERVERRLDIVQ